MTRVETTSYRCDTCGKIEAEEYRLIKLDHLYLPMWFHVCKQCRSVVLRLLKALGFEIQVFRQDMSIPERILIGEMDVQKILQRHQT
jgi:hypothetical protein